MIQPKKAGGRKSNTLIPSTAASGRPLFAVIAVMCYLASLALGVTLTVRQVASEYSKDLSGAITIQIKPSDTADPQQQMARAMAVLQSFPGLYDITPLSASKAAELVESYIGKGNLPASLRLPQMIDVRVDKTRQPDLAALESQLASEVPGASVNDHKAWKSRLLTFSSSLQFMALATLTLIIGATVAIVIFATRAAMAANKDVVEVLHMIGAEDKFIASEFQGHFLRLGMWSGLTGAGGGALTLILLTALGSSDVQYFIPNIAMPWTSVAALIAVPLTSALAAMYTARRTALAVCTQLFSTARTAQGRKMQKRRA